MQSVLQPVIGPRKEIHDLTGRVALVTGGALGIGYEISRAFVLNGARVIMVNRKEEQGQSAIDKIKEEAGADAKIEWIPCDMGNLKEIKEVFSGIRERESRLDLLILSAGINVNQYGETTDALDRHFEVNFLGQFYVVNQLWPLLRKTAKMPDTPPPRVVFESSEQHRNAPKVVHFGSLDEINNPEIGSTEVYGRTKLAIILGVKYGLLERVIKPNKDNIYALSVHPGAVRFFSSRLSVGCIANWGQVNTAMQQQWKDAYPGLLGKLLTTAMLAVGRNVEQGSYSALYAATSPEIEEKGWNGYYFSDVAQPGKESAQASDPMLGAALWDLSHRLIKEKVGEDGLVDWNA
jgi:NAD(P)-dependent dehydrogenase (short-subunit alcohol dehydrogenase family)